jgi:hypothetical protein
MLAIDHMKLSNGGKGGIMLNVSSLAGDNILRQNNKQRFTKHHTENQRLSNTNSNKNRRAQ